MKLHELSEQAGKQVLRDGRRSAQAQAPAFFSVQLSDIGDGFPGKLAHLDGKAMQTLAGGGEPHAGGGAFEEADAEFLLQGFDVRGDGRLAYVERFGGVSEAEADGDRAKDAEPVILQRCRQKNLPLGA